MYNPADEDDQIPLSPEEEEKFVKEQNDPDYIYNICGRVKNKVTAGGAALTPHGIQLCNTFTHVLKELYDFSKTLPPSEEASLRAILAKHESMPSDLINLITPRKL